MAKRPSLHPYADRASFERLLLLIATLIRYPGVGSATPGQPNPFGHNALEQVRSRLLQMAAEQNCSFSDCSIHTLRKDLLTLRRYGILNQHMYRWGYYLGTGALQQTELQMALHALASQAMYQGDPRVRQVYQTLERRLRGLDLELGGELFYPVRQHLNRVIVHTDPEEMMAIGKSQDTLFHQLEVLEQAIVAGQRVELVRGSDRFPVSRPGPFEAYPLQLLYHNTAWYLICEDPSSGHLATHRMNRLKNYCRLLAQEGRGIEAQKQSLAIAHQLLENGWGLFLGEVEEQAAERSGVLTYQQVKVRFFPPVSHLILEGDRRHIHQQVVPGPKDPTTYQPAYMDYQVKLPPRSLQEFSLWVNQALDSAQVLAPAELVEQHRQAAQRHYQRYV